MNINSKEYDYSFQDLGIEIDMDRTIENIKEYQRGLSYSRKLMIVNGKSPKVFPFLYRVDDTKLNEMLNNLKGQVDTAPIDGFFDTSNGVSYNKGVAGYSLNVEQSAQAIRDAFKNGLDEKQTVLLTGDVIAANGNESYAAIDTMTSGFVTDFMPNTYLRNINLNTALGYINGSVVEPGEVFSYCDKAGPFNKAGYVFYYEFVGNGVCQIATTTYNAALLGGLEIVKRYPHAKWWIGCNCC